MHDYVVYMHKCRDNGKIYIGKTNNIIRRWRCNGIEYKPYGRKENNTPFWNAIKAYGWDSFEHIILESDLTEKEAANREMYYIELYHAREKNIGYNVAIGGNGGRIYKEHPRGMAGKHHSKEKCKRQSELMKKLNAEGKCGAVWKNGHPRGMLGKHQSEEYKNRLRSIPASEHASAKACTIVYANKTRKDYDCLKYMETDLKVNKTTLIKIIKSQKQYRLSPCCHTNRNNLKKIDGAIIYYQKTPR